MKLIESQARFFMAIFKRNFDIFNESAQKTIKIGIIVFDIALILMFLNMIF